MYVLQRLTFQLTPEYILKGEGREGEAIKDSGYLSRRRPRDCRQGRRDISNSGGTRPEIMKRTRGDCRERSPTEKVR